ncbi:hypothetical protein IJI94_03055 [Candidatus Saccharibacteria bacterium]|nr:hypothetical protein [Candidatus Saccharibacteria bacterium]
MRNHVFTALGLIALVILLIMLNFTTPTTVGPFGVLVFFTTVYLLFFCVFLGLWRIFRRILGKKGNLKRKDYISVGVTAFAPIMLLLMQSMGSINVFTVIGVVLFVFLGCFLVIKRA